MTTVTTGILCLQFDSSIEAGDGANRMTEVDSVLAEINDVLRQAMPDRQPQFTRHMIYPTQAIVTHNNP